MKKASQGAMISSRDSEFLKTPSDCYYNTMNMVDLGIDSLSGSPDKKTP